MSANVRANALRKSPTPAPLLRSATFALCPLQLFLVGYFVECCIIAARTASPVTPEKQLIMNQISDSAKFQFATKEDAAAFRETISKAGLRYGRPIYWHDAARPFPKDVTGASCFFLRFSTTCVGVTAAHVVRKYLDAKTAVSTLVCQLQMAQFDLEAALIDIDDSQDIATFSITERTLTDTDTDPFDVSSFWPSKNVVKRGAAIQLVGYPENIRIINSSEHSALFQAWGALGFVEDYTDSDIWLVYNPETAIGAPVAPPVGYNMSGCSGGPAVIHETRGGLHLWHPVGLIIGGSKEGEGEMTKFDMIRVRRIDNIETSGCIRRTIGVGWLPP